MQLHSKNNECRIVTRPRVTITCGFQFSLCDVCYRMGTSSVWWGGVHHCRVPTQMCCQETAAPSVQVKLCKRDKDVRWSELDRILNRYSKLFSNYLISRLETICFLSHDDMIWQKVDYEVVEWRHWFFPLMFLQLLRRTVCMNNEPTDTLSVFTTRPTTVDHVPAPTGQFTVSASLAPSLHVLTPSHKSAAGPAKVKVFIYLIQFSIHSRDWTSSLHIFLHFNPSCRLFTRGSRAS